MEALNRAKQSTTNCTRQNVYYNFLGKSKPLQNANCLLGFVAVMDRKRLLEEDKRFLIQLPGP